MKLKQWVNKRGIEMWVRDSAGRPSRLVFGARREPKFPPVEGDYFIEAKIVSVDWVKANYGIAPSN